MYERVLVPLDGSPESDAILPFVEQIAGPIDAEVVLVTVVSPISAGEAMAAAGIAEPDALLVRELDAKRHLAGVERRLAAKGLRVTSRLRRGPPAPEILAVLGETRADLVAMSTHGRGGLGRLLFGSVAEAVLRQAPVPVLLIRATTRTVGAAR